MTLASNQTQRIRYLAFSPFRWAAKAVLAAVFVVLLAPLSLFGGLDGVQFDGQDTDKKRAR
jgi:hypothetical protein